MTNRVNIDYEFSTVVLFPKRILMPIRSGSDSTPPLRNMPAYITKHLISVPEGPVSRCAYRAHEPEPSFNDLIRLAAYTYPESISCGGVITSVLPHIPIAHPKK